MSLTHKDLTDLEDRLYARILSHIDTAAELAAHRVLDTHYKYCLDQRGKKWTAAASIFGLLIAAGGLYAAFR